MLIYGGAHGLSHPTAVHTHPIRRHYVRCLMHVLRVRVALVTRPPALRISHGIAGDAARVQDARLLIVGFAVRAERSLTA